MIGDYTKTTYYVTCDGTNCHEEIAGDIECEEDLIFLAERKDWTNPSGDTGDEWFCQECSKK